MRVGLIFIVAFLIVIVGVLRPIIVWVVLVILIVNCIATTFATEVAVVSMMAASSYRLVILTQQEKEGFLPCTLLRSIPGACAVTSCRCSPVSPARLNRCHPCTLLGNVASWSANLYCVAQEGLARPPLKSTEVSIEVIRKLGRLVILKSFVEDLEDLVEGTSLLCLLNGEASLLAIRIFIT